MVDDASPKPEPVAPLTPDEFLALCGTPEAQTAEVVPRLIATVKTLASLQKQVQDLSAILSVLAKSSPNRMVSVAFDEVRRRGDGRLELGQSPFGLVARWVPKQKLIERAGADDLPPSPLRLTPG